MPKKHSTEVLLKNMIGIQPSLYMCMLQCPSQGDDCLPLLGRIRHISKYINPKKLIVRGQGPNNLYFDSF